MKDTDEYKSRGSFVVEGAIVIPVVIFVVFLVMYICFVLYHQVFLQTLANEAAEKGASSWSSEVEFNGTFINDIPIEKLDKSGLYWRTFDTNKDIKLRTIDRYIREKLHSSNVLEKKNLSNIKTQIRLKNHIVNKKLEVVITEELNTPFDKVKKLLGLKEGMSITASAEAVIEDSSEFIRSTDFILDSIEEFSSSNKFKGIMEKIKKVISNFL